MKISEILHIAADEYLWDGTSNYWEEQESWTYTCDVVFCVCLDYDFDYLIIKQGLQEMGVDNNFVWQFEEFKTAEERQGARYLWLKWAALMAEEQGV